MLTIFEWRKAFMSPSGPESTTRLVLLAISTHMTIEGKSAWPSYECLARETGLSTRSVGEHVRRAEIWGWLRDVFFKGAGGRRPIRTNTPVSG
jgi:hypothetical protein